MGKESSGPETSVAEAPENATLNVGAKSPDLLKSRFFVRISKLAEDRLRFRV
jgi:hypothetical protein